MAQHFLLRASSSLGNLVARLFVSLMAAMIVSCPAAATDDATLSTSNEKSETTAIHGQATFVEQGHLAFDSPYSGPNSLDAGNVGKETFDITVFAGARLWSGAEVWINPEIDQGFGLSDTLGVAGFPSGEAYKVGKKTPYFRLQRLFLRQTFNLDGANDPIEASPNQLSGYRSTNRIVITAGKLSVPDIFDVNQYAHDARADFLNWSALDAGTFDYAADAWGYTVGAAAEWYRGTWTLRGGLFDLSDVPNSEKLDSHFSQYQIDLEVEKRYLIAAKTGKALITFFQSHGRMGRFDDAIHLSQTTGEPADIAAVRKYRDRSGVSFNVEQQISDDLGVFAHGGVANGNVEPYDFTDIDRTISVGLSLKGNSWNRVQDKFGLIGIVNGISAIHEQFLNAGGLGILVGDGKLPHPGPEEIMETYYDAVILDRMHLSIDYQFVNHPAYNRDRGPVSILALRVHAQF